VGSGEGVKPRLSQALTRGARPDSNSRLAVSSCITSNILLHQELYPKASRLVAQRQRQGFLASVTWVRALACMSVISAMSYLFIGLAGCSVDSGISCGAHKLIRTPRIIKKKKNCIQKFQILKLRGYICWE